MDAPIFTGNAVEGTTTLFETDFFGQPASPVAVRSSYTEKRSPWPWQDLHLRPYFPCRKIQDEKTPQRVLDDRTGDGFLRPRYGHGPHRAGSSRLWWQTYRNTVSRSWKHWVATPPSWRMRCSCLFLEYTMTMPCASSVVNRT